MIYILKKILVKNINKTKQKRLIKEILRIKGETITIMVILNESIIYHKLKLKKMFRKIFISNIN